MVIVRIGLDIAKAVFQVHGVDGHGKGHLEKPRLRCALLSKILTSNQASECRHDETPDQSVCRAGA